jgi:hypothetical protein
MGAKAEAILLTIVLTAALVVIFFDLTWWRP